jgi:hypothetical protein
MGCKTHSKPFNIVSKTYEGYKPRQLLNVDTLEWNSTLTTLAKTFLLSQMQNPTT